MASPARRPPPRANDPGRRPRSRQADGAQSGQAVHPGHRAAEALQHGDGIASPAARRVEAQYGIGALIDDVDIIAEIREAAVHREAGPGQQQPQIQHIR